MPDDPAAPVATPPAVPPVTTPAPADPPADKTFTQADLERIVGERLGRQKAQFADYDDIKAKAAKLDEIEKANLTETERLKADLEAAQQTATTATERAQNALINAAVIAEAAKAGAINPQAVAKLLDKTSLTVGDDGQVEGAAEAVTALLEAEQYLVGPSTPNPGPGGGGPRNTPPAGDLNQQITEATKAGQWAEVDALNAKKLAAARAAST